MLVYLAEMTNEWRTSETRPDGERIGVKTIGGDRFRRSSSRSQISLGMMLLMTMIACMLAAMFLYGTRIEEVQAELRLYFGYSSPNKGSETSRTMHLVFLLFTYSSPLLLAGAIATCRGLLQRRDQLPD